jgi:signal transduction histidine kinase
VDDLLQLSALEAGKMPPRFEPLELFRVAAEAAASLQPLAQRKGIVLRVEAFGDLPQVRADRGQLKQVLTNLLDNAIKFTQDGGTVRVSAAAAGDEVSVCVADNGPGIPAADLPRVFERFYRVDKARSREMGGTGLGLSIVKHIAEVHGGRVSVESAPDAGSAFRLHLPAIK